jgi:hypothetical protein
MDNHDVDLIINNFNFPSRILPPHVYLAALSTNATVIDA